MKDKYHWYVAYNYSDGKGSGFGSIEITSDSDLFIPSEIREYIIKRNNFNFCVLINWKSIDSNQLHSAKKEENEDS